MFESSSNERRSFFVKKSGATSEEAINSGFRWLLLQNTEENRKALFLAVPSESSLQGTILSAIGQPAVRALANNGRMSFNRTFLRLVTVNDATPLWGAKSCVVLALFPNRILLQVLDSCPTISQILVIPRRFAEIKRWVAKWNAAELKMS